MIDPEDLENNIEELLERLGHVETEITTLNSRLDRTDKIVDKFVDNTKRISELESQVRVLALSSERVINLENNLDERFKSYNNVTQDSFKEALNEAVKRALDMCEQRFDTLRAAWDKERKSRLDLVSNALENIDRIMSEHALNVGNSKQEIEENLQVVHQKVAELQQIIESEKTARNANYKLAHRVEVIEKRVNDLDNFVRDDLARDGD